jgi:rhamnose transport system permease protein
MALFVIVTASIESRFVSSNNIQFILTQTSLYALLAVGEAMVIITRNVDLSIGSIVGLSAYVSANQFQAHPGISIVTVFLVGLGVGMACGLVSGAIVAVGRVPSLVVTLAMLYIIRGVDTMIAGSKEVVASSEPDSFNNIPEHTALGVPVIAIVVAVVVAIAAYYMRSYRSGRDLYAIGSEPQAATLAGIPIARRVFAAFLISGAIAGLAGVVWASQYATITSTAANGLELQVIAAVVVGGVAIFGGSGTVLGAALGALLLNTINSALVVVNVSSFWSQAVAGALLIGAIAFDRLIALRVAPALRTRRSARG